jgi:hypothetical protein
MKEIPILFSAPMVRAILDGRKSQTRRIVKFPKDFDGRAVYDNHPFGLKYSLQDETIRRLFPKWNIGGILWVRETWRRNDLPTGYPYEYRATAEQDMTPIEGPWKPSIFMPREACRIRLEVTDVRVERLHDVTDADALAEGVLVRQNIFITGELTGAYKSLWESINGKGSWGKNPWVWIVEFKLLTGGDK